MCRPALLIADEPTTALDVTIQAQILKLIGDLQSELHMAVLLITHDLGVVANMADEVVVVYHGRLMERGALEDIYSDPRHPYLKALMRAVPRIGLDRGERLTPIREVERSSQGYVRTGREGARAVGVDAPLLTVRDLSKTYTGRKSGWLGSKADAPVRALDGVSFDVRRGECLGLVGESGCGKTTVSKILMRVVEADTGEATYHEDAGSFSLLDLEGDALTAFRRKAQYVFQDPVSSLNPRMTVFDIISEPLIIHRIGDRAERAAIVQELMGHVGLDPRFLSRYPHSFSGGQRQRIGIARALALNPELIICDEPVSALDVSVQAQVLNLLKDLQSELGLTYLFISHNLAVVDYMADRIAVMCAGHLVEVAPRARLFENPVHPYTRALLAAVPRTDPSARLDLGALMEGKVSNPGRLAGAVHGAQRSAAGTRRDRSGALGPGERGAACKGSGVNVEAVGLLLEEIGMGARADKSQLAADDAVDHEPIRFDVSLPIAFPDSPERMIEIACRQRLLLNQRLQQRPKSGQVPASPCGCADIALELSGPNRRQHLRCRGPGTALLAAVLTSHLN